MSNVTGAIVNVDECKVHENKDGRVDKTRSDLYLHFVNSHDNSVMEVTNVLRLVDENVEQLDDLFKVTQTSFPIFKSCDLRIEIGTVGK